MRADIVSRVDRVRTLSHARASPAAHDLESARPRLVHRAEVTRTQRAGSAAFRGRPRRVQRTPLLSLCFFFSSFTGETPQLASRPVESSVTTSSQQELMAAFSIYYTPKKQVRSQKPVVQRHTYSYHLPPLPPDGDSQCPASSRSSRSPFAAAACGAPPARP